MRILFCLFSLLLAAPTFAADPAYLQTLMDRAHQKKLYDDRVWHLLLHYMPNLFGGVTSEADGKKFFLAKDGKHNPRAELEATLRALFSADSNAPEELQPQCTFVRRYHWLREQLEIDAAQLPEKTCSQFATWRASLDPVGLTLVFSTYYINNPASMFGHTLIKFEHSGEKGKHSLLDYAANYAADTGDDNGLLFMLLGLTGGYPGNFVNYPYYFKIQQYVNRNSRDLWEYRLHFTQTQIDNAIEHLWELRTTYFSYFFFDENCAYHLLALLEAANPDLHLRDRFHLFTTPADTIKVLFEYSGLIDAGQYRPSLLSQIRQQMAIMNPEEKRVFKHFIRRPLKEVPATFTALPDARRALVVEAALNYWAMRQDSEVLSPEQRNLLKIRSAEGEASPVPEKRFSTPVEVGHATSRVGLGGGVQDGDGFGELRLRLAYHDLLANDRGYLPNSQIEMLSARLRFLGPQDDVHLEELIGVSVVSLTPLSMLVKKPSWNVAFGIETLHHEVCSDCNAGFVRGGPGLSLASRWIGEEIYYSFINMQLQYSGEFHDNLRLGPQAVAGLLVKIGEPIGFNVEANADWSATSEIHHNYAAKAALRLSLGLNWETRIETVLREADSEVTGMVHYYF